MASDNFSFPDKEGFFGEYGGKFVPETLMYALEELENTYNQLKDNKEFIDEFYKDLSAFVGRPSPLYFAQRLTDHYGSGSIWLKREDLNHTGAHKINNTVGQILLAKHMGKKRIIAETGAGQHGVATATVAAVQLEVQPWSSSEPSQLGLLMHNSVKNICARKSHTSVSAIARSIALERPNTGAGDAFSNVKTSDSGVLCAQTLLPISSQSSALSNSGQNVTFGRKN